MKIYEQIVIDIKNYIKSNKIYRGFKLPSINELCKKYRCSKGTVIKAYDTLCSEHIVYSSPQRGFFVADNLVRINDKENDKYDLATGNPLVKNLPIKDIQHCLNSAIEFYSNVSLAQGSKGVPSLLNVLPNILAKSNVYCKSRNVYISQGVLQILTLLSKMPFPSKKDVILIEEPSYKYYINFLKSENIKVKTIKRDENGVDLQELEKIFKNEKIKFFYTIPRNHNPLGTYYSSKTRKAIVNLAKKYDTYIVEDDYFSDLCSLPRYLPLYYYSDFENCIYLKSYSKTIPYIRMGIAVIPDDLTEIYEKWIDYSYYYSYYMPSLVSQATFESYIRSNTYEKHITILSKSIQEHLKIFRQVTSKWDNEAVRVIGGISGYYATLVLNSNIKSDRLIQSLKNKKVLIASNRRNYYNEEKFNNSVRISFANLNVSQLEHVLNTIYKEILKIYISNK